MLVILDGGPRRVFSKPLAVLSADTPDKVPAALDAAQTALAAGHHVAGWLGYDLGHAIEPKLAGRVPAGSLLQLGVFAAPVGNAPVPSDRAYAGPLTPEWDEAAYARRFARVKAYIAAGDIYQANLSFRSRFPFAGDALALYEQLRAASGAGHCGFVDDGEQQILSLSPELFFDLDSAGKIAVRPMKGTAPRGSDDESERAALLASEKNRAENLMIVDLIRNDLSRIAVGGSVAVENLFAVETYPTLHAMTSTVTALKRADAGLADILKALFPCGSVTGAPKIRAMEILDDLESSRRGIYCGAIGHFAPDGSARFNVAIRTLAIIGDHGVLGLGGGVVQDSQCADEYYECLLKARFFETARRPLNLIETLRFEDGFIRPDAHLDRMRNSAQTFGLAFDASRARDVLDSAVAGRAGRQRVRLTLDEQGVHLAKSHPLESDPPHWRWDLASQRVSSSDILLRHKTSWREPYDAEHPGLDELIFLNEQGEVAEGSRSNIFVERGDVLLTPPLSAGVLPGILRAELIAQGKAREAHLMPVDLNGTLWFGNSLRGLIRGVRP